MQYNKQDNTYTYTEEGLKKKIYYDESNNIMVSLVYNILNYKSSYGIITAFKHNKSYIYINVLWNQLKDLGKLRRLYKDVRTVDRKDLINEYQRLRNKYNINITDSHFDSMIFNDPVIYYEYNINECSKNRQSQIKSEMEKARNNL